MPEARERRLSKTQSEDTFYMLRIDVPSFAKPLIVSGVVRCCGFPPARFSGEMETLSFNTPLEYTSVKLNSDSNGLCSLVKAGCLNVTPKTSLLRLFFTRPHGQHESLFIIHKAISFHIEFTSAFNNRLRENDLLQFSLALD